MFTHANVGCLKVNCKVKYISNDLVTLVLNAIPYHPLKFLAHDLDRKMISHIQFKLLQRRI
jgi:hypothetical protein